MGTWVKRAYGRVHEQRFVLQVLIIAAAVVIDQISKNILASVLTPAVSVTVIPGVFNLTYIENKGASFGILQDKTWFFIIVTAITLLALGIYMVKERRKQTLWLRVCLSLIVAGAAGNFIDRIFNEGKVRDFFDFSGLHFPFIFNVADMCLVVGSIMLAIYLLFMHKEKDGKTLFARRDKKDELEEDETLEDDVEEKDRDDAETEGGKQEK